MQNKIIRLNALLLIIMFGLSCKSENIVNDSTYIEPQHYNFAFMIQNTTNYEMYRLHSNSGQSITFAPDPTIKVGPYFGWRWLFLGYTFDIKRLIEKNKSTEKQEYDLSLYSSKIGVDIYYRKFDGGYKIRNLKLRSDIDTSPLNGINFKGIKSKVTGINVYYIFNNKRFSYPAAFSQSTVQRISVGSPLLGFGYTQHELTIDWGKLYKLIDNKLGDAVSEINIDTTLPSGKVSYTDYSISGGYAYNWVFAKDFLFASSLTIGLAYKKTVGDIVEIYNTVHHKHLNTMDIDATARLGIVWNNTKWYAGISTIMNTYNYHKGNFRTNNIFGNINIYAGLNFGKKKSK